MEGEGGEGREGRGVGWFGVEVASVGHSLKFPRII